jgi:hypothetical protein
MILVDDVPVKTLKEDNPAYVFYVTEMKKIAKQTEATIIKSHANKIRLDASGNRRRPPMHSIQLSARVTTKDRGMEIWTFCETYNKKKDGRTSFSPRFIKLGGVQSFRPDKDAEVIFFLTRCADLGGLGYYIENLEAEARELNDKDAIELDVRYHIMRKLGLEDLRYYAKSWGIGNADSLAESVLRRVMLDTVTASEKNITVTKRGFGAFMDDIEKVNPLLTEARIVVSTLYSKGDIEYDKLTRKVKHVPSQTHLTIVPLDQKDRVVDFVAELLLTSKFIDAYETMKMDVFGQKKYEGGVSIKDLESAKTKEELLEYAKKLGVTVPLNIGEPKLRERLIAVIDASMTDEKQ